MPYTEPSETNALKQHIETVLATVPDFVEPAADKKQKPKLKINVIKDCAERGDIKLLAPLLKNSSIKKAFFTPVLDSFVFNTARFKEFLEYSSACNSYSKYLGQKIGLYMGDIPLIDRSEVVLNFPFKDCVLEGGQRKEDGLDTYFEYDDKEHGYTEKKSKRREVFYNEVLARDEIDSLFSPKAFCHAKRYESGKSSLCKKLNRDAELNKKRGLPEDTITDNLIIKGNNLLALHSLKEEFAGKVKLIYIDPPYNTGNDSFAYNDNFNHSSWLTFMKNRLEIARELLKEDGIIFISIDNNEFSKLHVLMSEVFGYENSLTTLVWLNKEGGGKSDSTHFRQKHEYILCFAKNKKYAVINPKDIEDIDRYKLEDQYVETRGKYQLIKLDSGSLGWVKSLDYPIEFEGKIYYAGGDKEKWKDRQNGGASIKDWGWRWSKDKYLWGLENDFIVFSNGNVYTKQYLNCDENGNIKKRMIQPTGIIEKYSNTQSNKHMKQLFGKVPFNYSKPEGLIFELLSYTTTDQNDIVLDYHLGSGTTAAVAHKMNRQYIGVEQMDYIDTVTVERLKKVIEGEQGGISKLENWHGGGSFVYMELAEKNEQAVRLISACKNLEELISIFDELRRKYFLHYNVRINEFCEEVKTDRFQSLSLKKQKEMFCRMLDLNQLYINTDDRHDDNSGLSMNDVAITEDFYRLFGDKNSCD